MPATEDVITDILFLGSYPFDIDILELRNSKRWASNALYSSEDWGCHVHPWILIASGTAFGKFVCEGSMRRPLGEPNPDDRVLPKLGSQTTQTRSIQPDRLVTFPLH